MNFFEKNKSEHSTEHSKQCICHGQQGLFLDKRHLSRTIAGMVVLASFVFIGGYFWGQKTAIDQLLHSVERDSFADQIYYSMCSLYDQKDDENNESDASSGDEEADQATDPLGVQLAENEQPNAPAESKTVPAATAQSKASKKYVAQLVGYPNKRSAEQLVQRLQKKGITTIVKTRPSTTKSGKSISWYQVVTQECDTLDGLQKMVSNIKKYERIRDIKIAEIS